MTLTGLPFLFSINMFGRKSRSTPRLFARGRELDPETAMAVADLSPHLMKDIGVSDYEAPRKPVDRLPGV